MGWGEDCLHKRGKVWYVAYRDDRGRPKEKSTGKTDYREAQDERNKFIQQIEQGLLPNAMSKWTLKAAIDNYVAWRTATASVNTARTEKTVLKPILAFFGPEKRLKSFTVQDFDAYQIHRSRCISSKLKRRVTGRSINYELYCLQRILDRANLWTLGMKKQYRRLDDTPVASPTALTPEQGRKLFATAAKEERWEVAFYCSLLAYSTGCRSWEIKTLRLSAINLAAGEITVEPKYAKNRRWRVVALNAISRRCIEKLLERANKAGATEPHHFLLPHSRTKHTQPDDPLKGAKGYDPTRHVTSWASAWRSLRTKAGLPNFRFHDLRHTFNTQLAETGAPISVLMAQVGHLDHQMSEHYTHISDRAKHAAVAKVESANPWLLHMLGVPVVQPKQSKEHTSGRTRLRQMTAYPLRHSVQRNSRVRPD